MNGQERLIAALIDNGEVFDLAGPDGQAIQRDEQGRQVVLLMATEPDAEAVATEVYPDDVPRVKDFDATVELLEDLAEQEAWVDAGAALDDDGQFNSWRVPAQELLDDVLEAAGRSGRDLDGAPKPENVERIQKLDLDARYEWFLRWVVTDEAAWALGDDEHYMTFPYEDGRSALVLWPHAAFALDWARHNDAPELQAFRLPLAKLQAELKIAKDAGEHVAVFPGPDEHSMVLEPDELREDLDQARRQEAAEAENGP